MILLVLVRDGTHEGGQGPENVPGHVGDGDKLELRLGGMDRQGIRLDRRIADFDTWTIRLDLELVDIEACTQIGVQFVGQLPLNLRVTVDVAKFEGKAGVLFLDRKSVV